nr:Chain C, Nuclear inclusion protein B fragment [Tobacco vein mottling virus]3MMG_D Chain D, Nuclear inclusion protein B fragment [Tobacco vein mottling virus]
ETVRFQSD